MRRDARQHQRNRRGLGARLPWLLLTIASVLTAFASGAEAAPITPGDFGAGAVVESFEGLDPADPNVGQATFANGTPIEGVFLPGSVMDYVFASGVTLLGPNTDVFSGDPFVHDWSVADGVAPDPPSNNWGANGTVSSGANVPLGDAYLAAFSASGTTTLTFTFATAVDRVGAFVAGAAGTDVTMVVFDTSGNLLESLTLPVGTVAGWASNFMGLERVEGIGRVEFTGVDFGLDGVTFEAAPPVPEPGTALLLFAGLVLLGRHARS